jgi:Peptidase A4 family
MTSNNAIEKVPSTVACRVTPHEFDVTTASVDELALYGIPSRPDPVSAPTDFAMWTTAFKKGFKLIKPELQVSPLRHGPVQGLNMGNSTSLNWAGAVITNYAPLSAVSVAAQWQIAWVWPGSSGFPEILSTWVGMDGFENTDVLQAGSDQIFDGPTETATLWFEWYPNASVDITNMPVGPGDTITCVVTATGPGSGTALFSVNGVTGSSISFGIPGGAEFFGSSAEFIAERPTMGGNFVSLPAYSEVVLSMISATLSDGSTMNLANNPISLTMMDDNDNVLSEPSTVNASTLVVFPPAPVKTIEKNPREKDGEKGHHVIENLPIMSAGKAAAARADGTHETFIAQRDRPMESK